MKSKDIKLNIIENYIDWYTYDELERQDMKDGAAQYVEEDHVDEVAQATSTLLSDIHSIEREYFIRELKNQARNLVEDTDNMEYARGVCELIAYMDSLPELDSAERAIQIAWELGVSNPDKMY